MDAFAQFTPDELMQRGSKIWKQLDELAASDPQAYREYIKSVKDSATNEGIAQSHIKPGFRLETKELSSDLSCVYHVNIATTDKLPPPPEDDPLNIPICISDIRTGEDKLSKVVDAIVNPTVLQKCNIDSFFKSDIIGLAIDCIEETFNVKLSKRTNKIFENEYKGPFGWDEKGRPLTDADIRKRSEVKTFAESAEETTLEALKLPGKKKSAIDPMIQELALESPKVLSNWTQRNTSSHTLLYCVLPNTKSQAEITLSLVDGVLHVKTCHHDILIPVSALKSLSECDAKFIKTTETLKIKIRK